MSRKMDAQRERERMLGLRKTKENDTTSRGNNSTEEMLESGNNELIDLVAEKVGQIKIMTSEIGRHTQESLSNLDKLSEQFSNVGATLDATVKRVGHLLKHNGGKHMWFMAAFVVFLFMTMWFLTGRSSK